MMKRGHFQKGSSLLWAALVSAAAILPVRANHVAFYGIGKEQVYQQTSDTAVVPDSTDGFGFNAFAVGTSADSIVLVTVTPPGAAFPDFLNSITGGFALDTTFGAQADLESNFPPGVYTFNAMSSDFSSTEGPAMLTLSGDAYPATTPMANFTAAQTVNSTNNFVVSWNAFANAGANDYIQLTLTDDSGNIVFNSGFPGQSTALAGTARSVTIPASTLSSGSTYQAALTFGHITSRDQTDYTGGLGVTTYSQQTRFNLMTTGSNTGGNSGGGIPPVLILSNPFNGAKSVAVSSPVVFSFSVPMQPVQSINWSANVTAANFSYTWSASGTNLTAKYSTDLPASATITWTLDPSGFKALDGTPLLAINNSGNFTTAGGGTGTNSPCGSTGSTNSGSISLFKTVRYVQTSASAPVIDPSEGALFGAFVASPTNNPVTQATLQFNGTTRTLTNLGASLPGLPTEFMLTDSFSSESAMNAAYPPGTYTFTVVRATGTAVVNLNLPAAAAPPTPQIVNLTQTLSFDPTADFTVQWLPFTGASTNDTISFDLNDSHGTDFHAPDLCIPRPLTNTATSILIPKNTFGVGGVMQGSLTFDHLASVDTNTIPTMPAFAGYSKTTDFHAGSSTATQPTLENVVRLPNGTVQFVVQGTAGATLTVEASSDLKTWVQLQSQLSATGLLNVSDTQAATMNYRFYRASAK